MYPYKPELKMNLDLRNGDLWAVIGAGGAAVTDFFSNASNSLDGLWGVIGFLAVLIVGQWLKISKHRTDRRRADELHAENLKVARQKTKQEKLETEMQELKLEEKKIEILERKEALTLKN